MNTLSGCDVRMRGEVLQFGMSQAAQQQQNAGPPLPGAVPGGPDLLQVQHTPGHTPSGSGQGMQDPSGGRGALRRSSIKKYFSVATEGLGNERRGLIIFMSKVQSKWCRFLKQPARAQNTLQLGVSNGETVNKRVRETEKPGKDKMMKETRASREL